VVLISSRAGVSRVTGDPDANCGCKLGRVAGKYGLAPDDRLVSRWVDARESTRELAEWFNQRVLEAVLLEAGLSPRDGEAENVYRLLTDEEVTSGMRIETRANLEREGVPVEEVEADFLSHQTVYNHLTVCLGASLPDPDTESRRSEAASKLGALESRTEAVAADTISRLDSADALTVGEFDVLVSVTVTCRDCHSQYSVRELLTGGGCDCADRE
jgi:hypothetical protein